jgi:hypothetical protein
LLLKALQSTRLCAKALPAVRSKHTARSKRNNFQDDFIELYS